MIAEYFRGRRNSLWQYLYGRQASRACGPFHAPSAGDVTLSLSLCEASEGDASTRTQLYLNRDTLTC
jgi:hypothetical protein